MSDTDNIVNENDNVTEDIKEGESGETPGCEETAAEDKKSGKKHFFSGKQASSEAKKLKDENEALKKQIAEMEANDRLADSIKRENERLNDLLGFKKNNESFELVDSYVISRSNVDWVNSVTLDKGTSAGIATGMVAITANGEVVGVVTEVGKNYAVVKTVLDASLEISAAIAASGHSGMVSGGYTSGQKDLLRMNYLPSSAVIRNRDQVVTAGSEVFPRNLILGYVVDAGLGDTGVAKFAYLEPAADIDNLEQVFIVTAYGQE